MTGTSHGGSWKDSLSDAIGNTPLIRLRRASDATGCTINDAEQRGVLKPGGMIVEGTAGNTGIGLTLVANVRGYRCLIVMPETQSKEKIDFLRMIGADLRLVPAKPYRDPGNYVHVSRRLAEETGGVWANQFDNLPSREGHRVSTGPEIWAQTDGKIDAFTCTCGTGGLWRAWRWRRRSGTPA
jgi:cysteine synthase A